MESPTPAGTLPCVSIVPLPMFERDAPAPAGPEARGPQTLVVRYGAMRAIAELPYDGGVRPGCGTKLVVTTPRGTEFAELLTVACGNGGCDKNLSREEVRDFIAHSGAEAYPFTTAGRVERIATAEDLDHWTKVKDKGHALLRPIRDAIQPLGLPIKVIEVELIFGGEVATIYTTVVKEAATNAATNAVRVHGAHPRPAGPAGGGIDLTPIARSASPLIPNAHITVLSVGPRDEARLVADYEKCGQHCCCQNFLKVLKPVSMKHARHQKPTMDPLKISGRCGRLMCCLRYEEQTYTELAARLPKRGARVGTPEGPGEVRDTKVLVQLVLVRLDDSGKEIAVPVEELTAAGAAGTPPSDHPEVETPSPADGGSQQSRRHRRPKRD